jgi:hypothetical protein
VDTDRELLNLKKIVDTGCSIFVVVDRGKPYMFRFSKGESKIARQLELTLFAHLLTLIIYEIFRQKSGTKAVKKESKSKPPLLVNVRFFSFPSGQCVQKAKIGHKKKRTTIFVPLFVPLFACRHFSYMFTVKVASSSRK